LCSTFVRRDAQVCRITLNRRGFVSSTVERARLQPLTPTSDATKKQVRRSLKGFYVAMALLMSAFAVAGFWQTYVGPLVTGRGVKLPAVMHVHALVYFGWTMLLVTQAGLVYRGRRGTHKRVGRIGIGYGLAVLVMGFVATFAAPARHVRAGDWTLDQAAGFLILPLGDMVLFGTLFVAAIVHRKRLEAHKRLILLATAALLFAPVARFAGPLGGPPAIIGVWLAPVLLAMGYDLWSRGRVHPAYLAGLALLIVGSVRVAFMESEGWLRIGRAIMRAIA
jgi:hypothetical protein